MQAIVTKYIAPTSNKGTRMKATCSQGEIVVGYDYSIDVELNHAAAAKALIEKLKWTVQDGYGMFYPGALANGDYCWVMVKDFKEEDTRCKVCGVEAAKHGYWAVDDPTTHKWKSK